jgi:hypothetical protein
MLTALLAAYEQQAKPTIIVICLRPVQVLMDWRFAKDEQVQYTGTRNNIVHHGNGCLTQLQ